MDSSEDNRRLKLLLVAYDFPPVASAGMYRIVGMAKYLQRYGWEVTVLTVRGTFGYESNELLEMIPDGVRVVRTRSFEFRRVWRSAMSRMGEKWSAEAGWQPRSSGLRKRFAGGVNFGFRLVDRFFRFPDLKAGWFWPLLIRFWRLLRSDHFDVVLSSSPPHSLQLPLLCVRFIKAFRWVADFRDPWTIPRRTDNQGLEFRIRRFLERRIINRCDFVVANTQGNLAALTAMFGEQFRDRACVITNGLDLETDPPEAGERFDQPACDLVYMGEVYSGMLDVYIRALRYMRDANMESMPTLWIYGQNSRSESVRAVREFDLEKWVVFKERVSYREGRSIVRRAKALLVSVPHRLGHETWVPSKLYSYLFSDAPILALVPEGDVSRIIVETGRGVVIRETDPVPVTEALSNAFARMNSGDFVGRPNERELQRYRMVAVVSMMNGVLSQIVRGPGPK